MLVELKILRNLGFVSLDEGGVLFCLNCYCLNFVGVKICMFCKKLFFLKLFKEFEISYVLF